MNLNKLTVILAIGIAAMTVSCDKEKIDEHPNFVGNWINDDGSGDLRYISIESSGQAKYVEDGVFVGYTESTGKFKIKGGDQVKIGVIGLSLDQYPEEVSNGNWEMTLDGDLYTGK